MVELGQRRGAADARTGRRRCVAELPLTVQSVSVVVLLSVHQAAAVVGSRVSADGAGCQRDAC